MINVGEKPKDVCSGCKVCLSVCPVGCIGMEDDNEGFSYPVVDNSICIKCKKCLRECPFEKTELLRSLNSFYASQTKKKEIIENSSSGAIFGTIALEILKQGGVVFGASYFGNEVHHTSLNNKNNLNQILGSKYVQSDLKESFTDCLKLLDENRLVLFSGTGCQINALKHFLNKDYINLLLIDIVCHGVPSKLLFSKYVHYVEKVRNKKIVYLNMRDKTNGWKSTRLRIFYDDGTSEFDTPLCHLYAKLFQSNLALRPCCYNCTFCQIDRAGDITLGDFWGYKNVRLDNSFDLKSGLSEVLINTEKGRHFFESISENLLYQSITKEDAILNQPQLKQPTIRPKRRENFYNVLNKYCFYLTASYFVGHGKLGKVFSKVKNLR